VWVDTPLAVCQRRDPKGLYAQARAGKLEGLTGVSAPYEPPPNPELRLPASEEDPHQLAEQIIELLPAGHLTGGQRAGSRG